MEAEKYFDFYEANGWRAGKNPMKKWQAAANNWMRRENEFNRQPPQQNGRPAPPELPKNVNLFPTE